MRGLWLVAGEMHGKQVVMPPFPRLDGAWGPWGPSHVLVEQVDKKNHPLAGFPKKEATHSSYGDAVAPAAPGA